LQSIPISDKSWRHVLRVKFYAYIYVANVLGFLIVARWLHPFGFASLAFGLVFAYLTIVTCEGGGSKTKAAGLRADALW